jgi:hypothetical protein
MADSSYFEAAQRYFTMAMKAQNQCRMTLETLSAIKNPPVIYARQANIATGLQQVNNGLASPSHASETQIPLNKLLETSNGRRNAGHDRQRQFGDGDHGKNQRGQRPQRVRPSWRGTPSRAERGPFYRRRCSPGFLSPHRG